MFYVLSALCSVLANRINREELRPSKFQLNKAQIAIKKLNKAIEGLQDMVSHNWNG